MEGNAKLAGEGLSQFAESLNQPDFGNDDYAKAMEKAIDYAQRLVQVAGAVDDPVLDAEVLKADVLSELVNLGVAYAALDPYRSSNSNFFLNTLWSNESIDKASGEFETYLKSYNGADKKQVIQVEQNLLEIIGKLPSTYARRQFREASTVQIWMRDMVNYLNLKNTLVVGEYILDSSTFYESVIQSNNSQKSLAVANDFYSYLKPDEVLVASTGNPILIAQDSIWSGAGDGLWWLLGGLGSGLGAGAMVLTDRFGKILRVDFSQADPSKTKEEQITDEAVGHMVEGATPTDGDRNPLKPGQKFKDKAPVQNYEKDGDETDQAIDMQNLADNVGTTVDIRVKGSGQTVQIVDLPNGDVASAYPVSGSTGGPTTQIERRRLGKTIKIRYVKGLKRANILIPTT